MPELPEVELVSRSLNSLVSGKRIAAAVLHRERLAPDITPGDFSRRLAGTAIRAVGRRGKHVLFDLDNGNTLIVHLRMSGRFSLLAAEREDPKFTHAVFHFSENERLVFDDQRHFGLMKLVGTHELASAKELAKLAPEPFSDDFSIGYFRGELSRSRRSIKEFLLDQTKVCGLGNIYAAEAMFAARVDPRISANSISARKAARLFECIRAVLHEAIEHNGTRPADGENIEDGYFSGSDPEGWFVYDRERRPCLHCSTPIIRLKQGGRSTYYCRRCQRK
jgi:formamidopyrimidine-DNA glycosylase